MGKKKIDANQKLVDDYIRDRKKYVQLTKKISGLIESLIHESDIQVHSVTARTKDVKKYQEKVNKEDKNYNKFNDVTDLSGIRIICYYIDQVDEIANLMKKNFTIDKKRSIDKKETLDPDQFGYLSLHYIAKLSKKRYDLPEYKRFKGKYFEIQIRTIFQHAWAEIEHDLGYKSAIEVPKDIRREFCRLAGLLELTDDEFLRIKNDLNTYSEKIDEQIKTSLKSIDLDRISLESYLNDSPIINEIDYYIAGRMGVEYFEITGVGRYLQKLQFFNFITIEEVDTAIKKNKNKILYLVNEWVDDDDDGYPVDSTPRGITLFYLFYILLYEGYDKIGILKYLNNQPIGLEHERDGIYNKLKLILDKYTE